MRLDARNLTSDTELTADICLVGAGAAGITLALALSGSGLSVIVLESGGLEPEPDTQQLAEGTMVGLKTWAPVDLRVRVLGGSTNHWAGYCRPLDSEDFAVRDWLAGSGWPITRRELDPYYVLAQQTLELGPLDYDPVSRAAKSGFPLLPFSLGVENRYYQLSKPTRMGVTYRAALDALEDVTVYTHANVTDITLGSGHHEVSSLKVQTLSGTTFRVSAGRYVLALGGLENARLLLASNTQQSSGVANGNDVVGRYFMEHPHYYAALTAVHGRAPSFEFYQIHPSDLRDAEDTRVVSILGAIGLTAATRAKEQLLNVTATIDPAPFDNTETGPIPLGIAQALTTRDGSKPGALALTLRCEQSPLANSRVTLNQNLDALGMPRLTLDWRIAPDDDVRTAKTARLIARELGAQGLGRLWFPREGERLVWSPQPGGHHMGTTRMGSDPQSSVVDANCRAHEVTNLYVMGASVFTTGGDANPTLTVVALSHRLAAHLRGTT